MFKDIDKIVTHRKHILEMAKQMRIKSFRETFPFLIQSMLFSDTMNPFPKIPIRNSMTEMIINKIPSMFDMSVHRESLPSKQH